MRVRTESGTIYRIEETQAPDTGRRGFTVTRESETGPNPNGIPLGYAPSGTTLRVKVGERIEVRPSLAHPGGLLTSPVVAILPDEE